MHAEKARVSDSSSYVRDIIANTSSSTDQVTIEPDGRWHTNNIGSTTPANNTPGNDTDDDIVEIQDTNPTHAVNQGTPATPDLSSASSAAPRPPNKRPISAVVDLTLSDDEEEPVRPPKRQNMASMSQSQSPYYSF